MVRLRRFACTHCRRVWRQDTSTLAEPRTRLTHAAVEWGLRALALECMSVSRVAAVLGVSWHTANNAILASAQATLSQAPGFVETGYLVPVVAGCDCSWRWVSGAQAASCSAGVRIPIAE